jgi:phage tail sheath gpL-like
MGLSIPITGVAIDFRVPGSYAEILFAQGPATAFAGVRDVVLVMPKTSAGTATVNTLYPLPNEQTAETLGGSGSMLHRAARKFLSVNKDAKLYGIAYAASSGGSPVAATAVLTIATNATGTGTLTVMVCGETCQFTFASGATPTTIGDGIVAAINAKTWLPCTAANVTGTVTLTAKIAGASQGTASLGVIRVRTEITTGIGTTAAFGGAFLGSGAAGADGTTTEAANLATALAVIAANRKYYIAVSEHSATGLGNVKTHVSTKSEPRRGLRSVAIGGYTGTLANVTTLATGRNYERLQIVWQPNSEHDVAELVGAMAAIRQKTEAVDTAYNHNGYSLSDILLPAYSPSDFPNTDDQNDAINDGITCIASNDAGAYVVKSVNTRSKNSAGTVDDFRATETHRVSVCDEFVDEELADFALNYAKQKLEDDELLADGKPNPNQKNKRGVMRPSRFKPHILQRMDSFDSQAKLQDLQASKDSLRVKKTGARLECGFDLHVIDLLDQATYRVSEVSTG